MADYLRYDDVEIGWLFPAQPADFVVTDEVVSKFCAATADGSGLYEAQDDGSPRRAPPMMAAIYLIDILKARGGPPGGVHAKQQLSFHRVIHVGDVLQTQGRVTDKYIKKERRYVVAEAETRNQKGQLVATGVITSIWGREE
ncbi:MAG: MaoC family dehydratase N-terminal domain-containing protein [Pseudomonadota bacterium]